jgi:hypothetical protein
MANGIEIVLYTKEENDDAIRLQHQGISVIYNNHLSLHAAIIDKSTIWYGSVNILGYRSLEDNLIRFYCCPLKIEMCAIMCPQCP